MPDAVRVESHVAEGSKGPISLGWSARKPKVALSVGVFPIHLSRQGFGENETAGK